MNIELIEVAGFQSAMRAMRLPHRSGEKSDSGWIEVCNIPDITHIPITCRSIGYEDVYESYCIGPNDLKLAQTLIKAGPSHSKALRGIIAWLEITMPWYLFNELDTYTVGHIPMGSTSSMHTDCRGLTGEELQKAKGNIRGDYEYTRVRAIGYMALRDMYYQRKTHRLPEWRYICDFIETLPLAKELIIV